MNRSNSLKGWVRMEIFLCDFLRDETMIWSQPPTRHVLKVGDFRFFCFSSVYTDLTVNSKPDEYPFVQYVNCTYINASSSVYLSTCLLVYQFVLLPVYVSTCLPYACLSVYLCV